MADNFDQQFDEAKRNIDENNAAHYVYYEIEKIDSHPDKEDVRKRWIWELLQNAHDARGPDGIIAEVRYNAEEEKLVFLHNGRGFKAGEIVHLIKAGTTKDEDDQKTHGKFGRGFLTTHLLSPRVEIAGQLSNGKWFDFTLERDNKTKDTLLESLKGSLAAFDKSKSNNKPAIPEGFTTQFMFPIRHLDAEEAVKAKEAVKAGIDALKQCAPYVIIFNREFLSIKIKEPDETRYFKRNGVPQLEASEIQQVTVVENDAEMEYLLAKSKHQETSVAVRMRSNRENLVCLKLEKNIPKLFSAFPLVSTHSLSFPAVINNPEFFLPVDRDRVQFNKNRDVFEEACNLLVNLIERATLEGWDHIHQWANFPNTEYLSQQMGTEWETCIKNLIDRIDQTPAVHTLSGELKSPFEAILPWTETEKSENVVALWDLLKDRQEFREHLPRRDEVIGWYNTIRSWKIYEYKPFNGLRLAEDIQSCCYLKYLQLLEGVCAVEWLDRFYDFLKKDGLFNDATHGYSFVPNQVGEFQKLSSLLRDKDIDEELKDIDHILGGNLRERLRHASLTSLEDVNNTNGLDNESILGDLIGDLNGDLKGDAVENKRFKEASVRLFAWIVHNKQYTDLWGFTVFAEGSNSEKLDIISLPLRKTNDDPDMEIPLAPIRAWNDDLQKYYELFPQRHILANDFYDAVPEEDIWQKLDERKIVRKNVIVRHPGKVSFEVFQPHDPLTKEDAHESEKEITISNIAFLTKESIGIIDKVRKNRSLAYKFWCFLTEWLVVHDSKGVEIIEDVLCTCGDTHRCYPAEWLKPVVDRKWVARDEKNKADRVEAEILVNLLRDFDPKRIGSQHTDHIGKLLEAIGISELDFILETFVDKNDHEAVDNAIKEILIKSDGNVNHFNQAIKYIEAVTSNENLPQDLENLLEATDGDISEVTEIAENLQEDEEFKQVVDARLKDRRTIKQNRSLGITVEEIVGDHLKKLNESFEVEAGDFEVESTHKGADYVITLAVNQKWWIEVKSARTDRVKMSSDQAQNAKDRGESFLLCVVPLEPGNTNPDPGTVKENMRFIADINNQIAPLCKKIDELKDVQTNINAESTSDVELVIEGGKASVIVKKSVWESNEAFPLQKLAEYLR